MNSAILALRYEENENHTLLPPTHMESLLFKRKNYHELAKRGEINFAVTPE